MVTLLLGHIGMTDPLFLYNDGWANAHLAHPPTRPVYIPAEVERDQHVLICIRHMPYCASRNCIHLGFMVPIKVKNEVEL